MAEPLTPKEQKRLRAIATEIKRFRRACARKTYTDTSEAWELLDWIYTEMIDLAPKKKTGGSTNDAYAQAPSE